MSIGYYIAAGVAIVALFCVVVSFVAGVTNGNRYTDGAYEAVFASGIAIFLIASGIAYGLKP